jgi:PEP-CTERM motif
MKTKIFITLLTIILIGGLLAAPGSAVLIVDTLNPTSYRTISDGGTEQGFASNFTIANPMTITSISSWLYYSGGSTTLEAAIYTGTWVAPVMVYTYNGTTYSTTFTCTDTKGYWYGPTGLDWLLPAGDYWAVININGTGFEGGMGLSPPGALDNNAYYVDGLYCAWNGSSDKFAWKIEATAVPLPSSLLLLGSGFLGLGAMGCRKKRG